MQVSRSGSETGGDADERGEASARDFARRAGLLYVSDEKPGIRRVRAGRGHRYLDAAGNPVRDPRQLQRIRDLAIPPAWTDVWICRSPRGHIQATGRDERGRKQYRYHARWRHVRDEAKFDRSLAFGEALGPLREQVDRDLARRGLPREKVLAAAVRILDTSLIRVGNEEYARENGSFGLTTLQAEHVEVKGATIRLCFRGKSGKEREIAMTDRRLARIIRRCQECPARRVFQYRQRDGAYRSVDSAAINDYLRNAMGGAFTAKDFRTWGGSLAALDALAAAGPAASTAEAKRRVARAIGAAAERLGNTAAVCRACYVHPAIVATYRDGSLAQRLAEPRGDDGSRVAADRLSPIERRLLRLLRGPPSGRPAAVRS